MPRHAPPFEKVKRAKYAHPKKRGERRHNRGRRAIAERTLGIPGFASVEDWIRYEFDERDARLAAEAAAAPLSPLPVFRARNLAERLTLMLYVLNVLGTGIPVERARTRQQETGVVKAGPATRKSLSEAEAKVREPAPEAEAEVIAKPEEETTYTPSTYDTSLAPGTASAGDRAAPTYIAMTMLGGAGVATQAARPGISDRIADMTRTTGLLMAAAASQISPRGAAQAVGASALLAGLSYAWYSMFGRSNDENASAYERLAELTGMLTEDERELINSLFPERNAASPVEAVSPFSPGDIAELEAIVAELVEDNIASSAFSSTDSASQQPESTTVMAEEASLAAKSRVKRSHLMAEPQVSRGIRVKKILVDPFVTTEATAPANATASANMTVPANATADPSSRSAYWAEEYKAAKNGTLEKSIFLMLSEGPKPGDRGSLYVPRESFPLADAWFTRMDELQVGTFRQEFQQEIEEESIASIYDPHSGAKSAELPDERWLHLGRYYLQLYRRALYDWGMGLLHMNVEEARDEEVLVQRLETLTNRLNDDWEGNAMDAGELKEYAAKSKKLAERTARLATYSADRPSTDIMKNTSLSFSTDIPASEVFFGQYSLSYVDLIDRSRFSGTFPQYLKIMLISLVDLIRDDTGHVDLVTLYTAWSILTVKRLLHALENDDMVAAYDFAVLDEELNKIIKEHIFLLWNEQTQSKYFELYNESIVEALPLLWAMEARHTSETATSQPATVGNTTVSTEHALLTGVDWENIRQQAEQAEPMPERFSADKYMLDKLKTILDRRIADLTDFLGENILHPDRYMTAFVRESLEMYGLEDKWSDQSIITSRPVVLKAGVGMDVKGKLTTTIPSRSYTLVDIARGVPRRDYGTSYTDDVIEWPSSFPSALKERLGNMGDFADWRIQDEFDLNNPEGGQKARKAYKFMLDRAALAYIDRKNRVSKASQGEYHQRYIDAVESFLKGETKAESVEWHGVTLADVIFIPVSPSLVPKQKKIGVLLSLWNNDYCEVPWPGFAGKVHKEGRGRKVSPGVVIEKYPAIKAFMEKHRTIRTGKALAKVDDSYDYRAEHYDAPAYSMDMTSEVSSSDYYPPFITYAKTPDVLFDKLIDMHRKDLVDLYDDLIYSSAEHKRAVAFELINTLAILSGVLLMVGGVMLGGPALPWVAASLAVTLLGEVVPTAVLASLADDEEERELYIRSMVMAAAFELGGNLAGPAIGGVVKGTRRLARLGNTAVKETLPDLYRVVKEKLVQVMTKTGIRRLRKVPDTVTTISKEARSDLDKVVETLKASDTARPSVKTKPSDKTDAAAGSSKQQTDTGAGAAANNIAGEGLLKQSKTAKKVISKMRELGFKSDIRILTRWKKGSTTDEVINQYFVQGRRGNDRVVVQMFSDNNEFSYIYFDENEWLQTVIKKSKQTDDVTGYYDVKNDADFSELFEEFEPMTEAAGSLPLKDYPADGVLIYTSQEYKNSVKSTGLDFDDMQEFFEKTLGVEKGAEAETSLSASIRQALKENPELQSSLKSLPFFADVPVNLSQGDLIMKYAALLKEIGPDITKFRPIMQDLALNLRDPTKIKNLTNFYNYELQNSGFQIAAPDFITYKANVGKKWWGRFIPSKNIDKVETAFNKTYTRADQLSALLGQAKASPELRDAILVVLARYLNTPDATILGEAYQRLDELSSRLYQQAHYHVKETKLSRVVPVTASEGDISQTVAFVYERDPSARIMLVFPTVLEEKGIKNTLLHEMTHHAIGSEDYAYIADLGKKFPNLKQHHFRFGESRWESFSPHATLGRTAQTSAEYLVNELPPLNTLDRAIAQARALFLAMERAYTKMNNADSLVVLINELLSSFKFKWVGDEKTGHWAITLATGSRTRRSVDEEDAFMKELVDNLTATQLAQALDFSVAGIFTDEEIKKFGLELTDSAGTNTTQAMNTTQAITPDA